MFSSVLLFLDHMIVVMKLEACKGQRCICSVLVTSCRISSRIMGRCWRCAARWFWWTGDVGFTAWGHFEDGYPLLTCLGFYKYEYMYLHCWLGVAWLYMIWEGLLWVSWSCFVGSMQSLEWFNCCCLRRVSDIVVLYQVYVIFAMAVRWYDLQYVHLRIIERVCAWSRFHVNGWPVGVRHEFFLTWWSELKEGIPIFGASMRH